MNPSNRRQRGQAVVEMALGTLVFVTVLVFAIHFSEVGFYSLKVQEANASALWDSTAHTMHHFPLIYDSPGTIASTAVASANARYADFDGRTSTPGGASNGVFTKGTSPVVNCGGTGGLGFGMIPLIVSAGVYRDKGGMGCQTQATISAFNFPTHLFERSMGDGTFKVNNYAGNPNIKICAMGRAAGGACKGELATMIDDWGLAGSTESIACAMVPNGFVAAPCTNPQYWLGVAWLYQWTSLLSLGKGSGTAFAASVVGASPTLLGLGVFENNEDAFWMSFMGESTAFLQPTLSLPPEGLIVYPTTPGSTTPLPWSYPISYGNRTRCFLGRSCT